MLSEALTLKTCRLCGAEKPRDTGFYLRTESDKPRNECKDCSRARLRSKVETPEQMRANYLRSKFGISVAEYDAMYAVQNGLCALCGTSADQSYHGLHVDHDHATGRIRGLLCQRCNMALGLFKDSVTVLAEAIAYLARSADSAD